VRLVASAEGAERDFRVVSERSQNRGAVEEVFALYSEDVEVEVSFYHLYVTS